MTTISATVNATRDAVTITVADAPTGTTTVTRRDRNGVRAVRDAVVGGQVTDWEVALGGTVVYVAVDSSGATATTTLTMPATGATQLRQTYHPDVAHLVTAAAGFLITDLPADRSLRRTEHQVINRPDVLFTTGRVGLRSGTMRVLCPSLTGARAVLRLYSNGQVVNLRAGNTDGLDMHHLGLDLSSSPDTQDPRRWVVSVAYAEVDPGLTRTTLGWTWSEAARTWASWAEVLAAYDTWAALAADQRAGQ